MPAVSKSWTLLYEGYQKSAKLYADIAEQILVLFQNEVDEKVREKLREDGMKAACESKRFTELSRETRRKFPLKCVSGGQ